MARQFQNGSSPERQRLRSRTFLCSPGLHSTCINARTEIPAHRNSERRKNPAGSNRFQMAARRFTQSLLFQGAAWSVTAHATFPAVSRLKDRMTSSGKSAEINNMLLSKGDSGMSLVRIAARSELSACGKVKEFMASGKCCASPI